MLLKKSNSNICNPLELCNTRRVPTPKYNLEGSSRIGLQGTKMFFSVMQTQNKWGSSPSVNCVIGKEMACTESMKCFKHLGHRKLFHFLDIEFIVNVVALLDCAWYQPLIVI